MKDHDSSDRTVMCARSSGWDTAGVWHPCFPELCLAVCRARRDEWTEAIQMVADKLQRQEEERFQCSPTSNIDNMVEEEMDISTTHHKRKVARAHSPSHTAH